MRFIFDLDGTLSDCGHRLHFIAGKQKYWDSFNRACVDDTIIEPIATTLLSMSGEGDWIEIWTGRNEATRKETINWLRICGGILIKDEFYQVYRGLPAPGYHVDRLLMRPEGDHRHDDVLKQEWLDFYNTPKIDMVFEDRSRVVEMWRRNGIMCCQVAEGNF